MHDDLVQVGHNEFRTTFCANSRWQLPSESETLIGISKFIYGQ